MNKRMKKGEKWNERHKSMNKNAKWNEGKKKNEKWGNMELN